MALISDSVRAFALAMKSMLNRKSSRLLVTDTLSRRAAGVEPTLRCNLTDSFHDFSNPNVHAYRHEDGYLVHTSAVGRELMSTLTSESFEGLTGPVSFDKNGFRNNYSLGLYELRMKTAQHPAGLHHVGKFHCCSCY